MWWWRHSYRDHESFFYQVCSPDVVVWRRRYYDVTHPMTSCDGRIYFWLKMSVGDILEIWIFRIMFLLQKWYSNKVWGKSVPCVVELFCGNEPNRDHRGERSENSFPLAAVICIFLLICQSRGEDLETFTDFPPCPVSARRPELWFVVSRAKRLEVQLVFVGPRSRTGEPEAGKKNCIAFHQFSLKPGHRQTHTHLSI